MVKDSELEQADDVAESAEGEGGKSFSAKKLILFVVLPLLLLGGGGTGLYVSGLLDGVLGKEAAVEDDAHGDAGAHDEGHDEAAGPGFFYEMPEMIVNLDPSNRRARFLKLTIALELNEEHDALAIEAVLPRVTDHFQTYLRELRVSDLQGSAGVYRLRQELLARVQAAAEDVEIRDVLFKEILIQ